MEKRELTCIVCPIGCSISVELEEGRVLSVSGNGCPRGAKYAESECINPVRTLTSTVKTTREGVMLPVKTASPIPKSKMLECARALCGVVASPPVKEGDIIVADLCSTGVSLIATGEID